MRRSAARPHVEFKGADGFVPFRAYSLTLDARDLQQQPEPASCALDPIGNLRSGCATISLLLNPPFLSVLNAWLSCRCLMFGCKRASARSWSWSWRGLQRDSMYPCCHVRQHRSRKVHSMIAVCMCCQPGASVGVQRALCMCRFGARQAAQPVSSCCSDWTTENAHHSNVLARVCFCKAAVAV